MPTITEANNNLALFCDFENVALGVRDAKFPKFDMQLVLERLLLKGNIIVKKAYCDWDRYKEFKPIMHDTAFELIEIPHTRQSGKNSADIRMVVDALDLCYTKGHILKEGRHVHTSCHTQLQQPPQTSKTTPQSFDQWRTRSCPTIPPASPQI